jgi:phytoene dehydrogenase-like protein
MLYSYSTITAKNGGIPKGGSKLFVEKMKEYFLELGGTLKLSTEIKEILVENKKAVGVVTDKGETFYGDYVVPTISPEFVTKDLLKNKYSLPSFTKRFNKNNPIPTCCLAYYEIEDMPYIDTHFTFQARELSVGTKKVSHIGIRNFNYDPETYVKNNKTIVGVLLDQYDEDFFYWDNLYNNDKEGYYKEKERLLKEIEERIVERFPEIKGKITALDFSTPYTFKRYTNSSRGGFMSFLFTSKNSMYHAYKIKGIKNLYLAGQWVSSPGGVPFALMTGQHVIQAICRKENIKCLSLNNFKLSKN